MIPLLSEWEQQAYSRGLMHGLQVSLPFVWQVGERYEWGYEDGTPRTQLYAKAYIAGYDAGLLAVTPN